MGTGIPEDRHLRPVSREAVVVVLAGRDEDRVPPRPSGKPDARLHDRPREMRVIGLSNQLDAIIKNADNHVATST